MARIILTGDRGYIGSCLAAQLKDTQHQIITLPKRLENLEARSLEADYVLHCASERSLLHSDKLQHSNVLGTQKLLAALCSPTPMLYLSSRMVYGHQALNQYCETDTPRPDTAYGKSKLEAESLIKNSGFPFLILRLTSIYGLGINQTGRTFVEQVLNALFKQEKIVLFQNSGLRDYLYVWDLVAQIQEFLFTQKLWNETYNLGGQARLLLPLIEKCIQIYAQVVNRSPEIYYQFAPNLVPPILMNSQKAHGALGKVHFSPDEQVLKDLLHARLKK